MQTPSNLKESEAAGGWRKQLDRKNRVQLQQGPCQKQLDRKNRVQLQLYIKQYSLNVQLNVNVALRPMAPSSSFLREDTFFRILSSMQRLCTCAVILYLISLSSTTLDLIFAKIPKRAPTKTRTRESVSLSRFCPWTFQLFIYLCHRRHNNSKQRPIQPAIPSLLPLTSRD
jgi:hypothetical protein